MRSELVPAEVTARLAALRGRCAPELIDEARHRLERERPRSKEPLERVAARCLAELHALCELTRYLQRGR